MESGDLVQVRAFGGQVLTRRVVSCTGTGVVICREDEYQSACLEGRAPLGIHFKMRDVVGQVRGGKAFTSPAS